MLLPARLPFASDSPLLQPFRVACIFDQCSCYHQYPLLTLRNTFYRSLFFHTIMAVANEITAQEARTQHHAYRTKAVARCSSHSVQSKRAEKQNEPQALQIDTEDYGPPQSYQGPVKPPQRQLPVTYPQSPKPYHYRRPSLTHSASLGPVRHHKTRYRRKEKHWSDTGREQAALSLHDAGSNNNAASPVRCPVLTETAAELCVYFTSKGMHKLPATTCWLC